MKLNQKVTKAVIPVAGLGTRMLPATKAIPKEMLPIVDKPMIQYIVNECIAAGPKHVTIMHVRQGVAKGLGHAVLCAKPLVGNEPFAVVLPDVIIDEAESDLNTENMSEMLRLFNENDISQIMVEPVPMNLVSNYGVADVSGEELQPGDSAAMTQVVEKPPQNEAPSNLAVVGRYVLSAKIWDLLEMTPTGAGDEIQLTDAIAMLMDKETVNAFHMTGKSHDCGSKLGFMMANVEYAARHPALKEDFLEYLQKFCNKQ